jgi:hypothetical protein
MSDLEVEAVLARALFQTDIKSSALSVSIEEKKSKWAENNKEYRRSARRLIKLLGRQGISLNSTLASAEE